MTVPRPPRDLDRRDPLLLELPDGSSLHRFYDPIFFDTSTLGRFNAPDGSYGVLYASENKAGAFAETFLRTPGRTLIDAALLSSKAYVQVTTNRSLRFIRMAGPGLARLGATAEVTHGGLPYAASQAWSIALSKHPIKADGIAYHSRHDDDEMCFGLFDSAIGSFVEVMREIDLDQNWFWELADRYSIGLAP